jgi:type II secretory pathway pseudopilin PulG
MLTVSREKRESQTGMTLIELLIGMIIATIVGTMLVGTWISLQRAYGTTTKANWSRAAARDAMSRISSELRDAQPTTLATATPTPSAAAVFINAKPMEVSFYSAYNLAGAQNDTTGVTAMRLTRIWLDTTSGSTPQKTLYWQRRTDASTTGAWTDPSVRKMVLADNVVNNSIPSTSAPTPIFMYAYRDGTGAVLWTDNSAGTLDLTKVISVRVRLIVDANLAHSPTYTDLSTTVRPRNASGF